MQIYEKVRAYLEQNSIDPMTVAHKAGIPVITFNAIISGRQPMFAEDLKAICEALHVSATLFIDYTAAQ